MEKSVDIIVIKDEKIEIKVRNIKGSKSIKIYIEGGVICINKPRYVSKKEALKMLYENKEKIYEMYKAERSTSISRLITEDIEFLYNGKLMTMHLVEKNCNKAKIELIDNKLVVEVPNTLEDKEKIEIITKKLKIFFKEKLNEILKEKVDYYAKIMNLEYTSYSIKSMKTRLGSCNTKTKKLNFNVNLIFMTEEVRDSIIIHELSHILHANHSHDFYNLVYKFCSNYDACRKWIKKNHKYLGLL
ncbi:MAG: DUF45 domain-containing protein [Clostridia bacterium]|nr:DUF45 domain-containing protein [Clostridia bacterium]